MGGPLNLSGDGRREPADKWLGPGRTIGYLRAGRGL